MTVSARQAGSTREDIAAIVAKAQDDLRARPTGPLGQHLMRAVLPMLKRVEDYDALATVLQRLLDDLNHYQVTLQAALEKVKEAERARANAERFGEVWWKRRQRQVEEAFQTGPEEGRRRWLATYSEALVAERFDVCHRMTLSGWPSPDDVDLFKAGAAALKERRYRDAVEALEALADASTGMAPSEASMATTVLVFLGRIHLYELSNLTAARQWIEHALELAPTDGRALAALGECLRMAGDTEEARQAFARAVQLSPHLPDGYIGTALLCEDRQWWHRALGWYDEAFEEAGEDASYGQFLAPAPGGLYWQLARRLRGRDPEAALEAVDRALDLGVRWSKEYPERQALADRAAILERLGRRPEAAASYFEAGRRYSWLGNEKKARPLLQKACELDPSNAVAWWQLSESLRVLSYRNEAPFVDLELVHKSKQAWEAGSAMRRPDPDTAWAYLGRALLNEQRWTVRQDPELLWEGAMFLECALLLNGVYATAWAYLGQSHRVLGNLATALDATERALSIDPADVAALEQHAAVLVGLGRYAEAEQVMDQRLERAEEWWAVAVKAYAVLRSGRTEEALALIDRAVEAVPDDEQYRSMRALCHRLLGRRDLAEEDYRWIWERRTTEDGSLSAQVIAWAGYMLGELDEAADRYQDAIEKGEGELETLWCDLGQVRLARSDPARDDVVEGERALAHGISLSGRPTQLRDLLDLDLEELERVLTGRPDTGPALAALAKVRALAAEAYQRLSRAERTADDELHDAEAAPKTSSRWLAAQAGLARRAGTAGRWRDALDAYVALNASGSFPEADIGLAEAIGKLQEQADKLVGDGHMTEARDFTLRLLEIAEAHLPGRADVLAGLHARAAFASLALSDEEAALRHLSRTMAESSTDGGSTDELAALEQRFLRSPADYWAHVDGLRELHRRCEPGSPELVGLDVLADRLSLSRLYRLAASDADKAVTFPIATPLALKVGREVLRKGSLSLRGDLTDLRARVEADTGIHIPGVRVIFDDSIGPGDYAILIDETPVAWGSLVPHGVFVLHEHAGGALPSGLPGRDPLSGRPGVWVIDPGERLADVPQREPVAFVLRHLEATVRRGLACFGSLDDVQAWLDRSRDTDPILARIALPDRSSRVLLSRVLQALASEGVPLTDRNAVLLAMQETPQGAGVFEVAAAVRLRLRARLPGNAPGTRRVVVPAPLEERLAAGLHGETGPTYWELPRDQSAALSQELRDLGEGSPDQAVALVVGASRLRPFVWRLLAPAPPFTSVLSEEELLGPDGRAAATASGLAGHPSATAEQQGG